MSIYFEKARELGRLILESDQSIRLVHATEDFQQTSEAVEKMNDYKSYQQNIQFSMQQGKMNQDEFKIATKRLTEMSVELKQDPIIGALVFAENEFNGFVNQVLNVLKLTITGGEENTCGCGGCSGNCGETECDCGSGGCSCDE